MTSSFWAPGVNSMFAGENDWINPHAPKMFPMKYLKEKKKIERRDVFRTV